MDMIQLCLRLRRLELKLFEHEDICFVPNLFYYSSSKKFVKLKVIQIWWIDKLVAH